MVPMTPPGLLDCRKDRRRRNFAGLVLLWSFWFETWRSSGPPVFTYARNSSHWASLKSATFGRAARCSLKRSVSSAVFVDEIEKEPAFEQRVVHCRSGLAACRLVPWGVQAGGRQLLGDVWCAGP